MKNICSNNEIQSQNYIICELHGFDGIELTENEKYTINNNLIKYIHINDNLKNILIELQDNVSYSDCYDEIKNFLYHICFNLIIKTGLRYNKPTYAITVVYKNNENILIKDNIIMHDTIKFTYNYQAKDIYDTIITSPTKIKENFVKYERIFKTLHNPNNIVQFMSLYQFLMELLQGTNPYPSQKSITTYLTKNKGKYKFLSFKTTRKSGVSYDEDCFTYIRNEIGHSETTNDLNLYKNLGQQVDQQLIKNLVLVINDIILKDSN